MKHLKTIVAYLALMMLVTWPYSVTATTTSVNVGHGSSVAEYGNAAHGQMVQWSFSGSNPLVAITVKAMDSQNYTNFGINTINATILSSGLNASSGSFNPPYSSTWYIVFINDDPINQTTHLTYTVTFPSASGSLTFPWLTFIVLVGPFIIIAAIVVAIIVIVVVVRRRKLSK